VGPTADYISGKNDYERNRLPVEEFVRRAKPMLPEIEAVGPAARLLGNTRKAGAARARRRRRLRDHEATPAGHAAIQ